MTHKDMELVQKAALASICISIILIVLKSGAWIVTNSIGLQASLIDSLIDSATSIFNFFAVRHAQRPADKQHRFGYGKAEAIAALGQSIFIVTSAIWLFLEVLNRFLNPQSIKTSAIGILAIIISIILTSFLIAIQIYIIKITKSAAIKADFIHYASDLLINLGIIATLIFYQWTGFTWLDPFTGGIISVYILYTAIQMVKESIHILMDKELDDNIRNKIEKIVLEHPKSKGIHGLRTRNGGTYIFIQLHLKLDGDVSLKESHNITNDITNKLIIYFPMADILIHKDPTNIDMT
jgi:ferrous-iron efflux pump FieF